MRDHKPVPGAHAERVGSCADLVPAIIERRELLLGTRKPVPIWREMPWLQFPP